MCERPRETNSVLFSLRELRRIEDDRVKKEQDEARARAEADAPRRKRQTAPPETPRSADGSTTRTRARRARDEEEPASARTPCALQEAERRARVEGEVRINEERMRLDAQHGRSTRR